jgi:hypothetical protein
MVVFLWVTSVIFVTGLDLKHVSYLGYFLTLVTFTAYADLLLSLSFAFPNQFPLGLFFFKVGEPYYATSSGYFTLLWDGTFHFALQGLLALYTLTFRDYHFLGLVLSGSLLNLLIPLLLGGAIGPFSSAIHSTTAANMAYALFPIGFSMYLIGQKREKEHPGEEENEEDEASHGRVRSHTAMVDVVLFLYNFALPMIHLIRLLCVLGANHSLAKQWVRIEPLLNAQQHEQTLSQDFATFRIQVCLWAFWYIPWHVLALYEQIQRIRTNKRTVLLGKYGVCISAIVFGGYLQSVAWLVFTSVVDVNKESEGGLKLRTDMTLPQEFWLVNLGTIIASCLHFVHFHVQDVEDLKQD